MRLKSSYLLILFAITLAFAAVQSFPNVAHADEDEITKEETASKEIADKPDWNAALKERYGLTDEQISKMRTAGLKYPGMAITAQLAKDSGKPVDEVMKMRLEQKMGWGKIAKELGVHPGEIGKAVAGMRKEIHEKRFDEKMARKEEHLQKRMDKLKERKERHEQMKDSRGKHPKM